jgi:predicted MPP superfamily phosphohydrolase
MHGSADPIIRGTEAGPSAAFPAIPPSTGSLSPAIQTAKIGPWLQLFTAQNFEWTQVRLPIPALPGGLDGLRILHLSDLHVRIRWDKAYDELIARVEQNPPDIIVYTGDFVDNRHDHRRTLPTLRRLVNGLKSRLGSVACLGNHDGDLLGPGLLSLNLTLLDHRLLTLTAGSATLEIIGLCGVDILDLDIPFLRCLGPKPPNSVRIALCHYPELLCKVQFLNPDLYLAGHTHGGQVCLPGRIPILRHDFLPRRLCSGVHRINNSWLIVNRGLGFSSLPIRVFCPAEVIEIRLEKVVEHPLHRVRSFKIEAPYTLRVGFEDATEQVIDFRPVLGGKLLGPLQDLAIFNQVRIDPEVRTLVWPNGADFDPATLHDWPTHVHALAARARQWNLSPT